MKEERESCIEIEDCSGDMDVFCRRLLKNEKKCFAKMCWISERKRSPTCASSMKHLHFRAPASSHEKTKNAIMVSIQLKARSAHR